MCIQDIAITNIDNGLTDFISILSKGGKKKPPQTTCAFQLTRAAWLCFPVIWSLLKSSNVKKRNKTQTWQRRATKTLPYNAQWDGFCGKPMRAPQGNAWAYTRIVPAYVMQPNAASTCYNFTLCLWVVITDCLILVGKILFNFPWRHQRYMYYSKNIFPCHHLNFKHRFLLI